MRPHDYVRVAAVAACSVPTVTAFVKGHRKTHPAIAREIEAAIVQLGLVGEVEAVRASVPGGGQ